MKLWQDIVRTALVGTERQPLTLATSGDALDALLTRIDTTDQERALLEAAAMTALWKQAGQQPSVHSQPRHAPCPPDEDPRCSLRAGQHLALMLNGQYTEVLPEWLAAVAGAHQRVPEDALPALLELGRKQPNLRAAIMPVLGRRGRWLAAQNPDWAYVAGDDDETTWETGGRPQRLSMISRLRADKPALARELLAATWAEETADDRAVFLSTFQTGLSMTDEPFLEEALDDRRKEVRRTAADLLAQLSESRLCHRMLKRVRPLLTLTPSRKPRIEVTLPEACDKEMLRDGIDPKPLPGLGEKAWWLVQMLGAVPPSTWCLAWNKTPIELMQAAGGDWERALLEGWTLAAQRHRDADWAEVLLDAWWARSRDKTPPPIRDWEGVLSPARLQGYIRHRLEAHRGAVPGDHPALLQLRQCRHPWSGELARMVLDIVRRRIAKSGSSHQADWHLRMLLNDLALYMPPTLVQEAATGWPTEAKDWTGWAQAVGEFLAVLQFRHDMLKEIVA